MQTVSFFFDWQNIYMRAREAHCYGATTAMKGQVDPVDLAKLLLEKHMDGTGQEARIGEIRIYRGRPSGDKAPKAYAAFQRQTSKWQTNSKVVLTSSDLRYPHDWDVATQRGSYPAREKGIDVALAVDLVNLAAKRSFDHAIVMSADYDLVPAIKLVYEARFKEQDAPSVSVAAWRSKSEGRPLRIMFGDRKPYCHWLDEQDYWGVEDETDYTLQAEDKPRPSGPVPGPFQLRR